MTRISHLLQILLVLVMKKNQNCRWKFHIYCRERPNYSLKKHKVHAHVPKLACNLLPVSKLPKDSNYCVVFSDSHYEFQGQHLRKMIGNTTMRDGLYCLDERSFINKNAQYLSGNVVLVQTLLMNKLCFGVID